MRNWRGGIWASFARISPHAGVGRRCARSSTTPLRRCSSSVSARGACWTPRGQVGSRASGPFLYGVIRNVARRFESRPVRAAGPLPEIATDDAEPIPPLRPDLGPGDHGRGRSVATRTGGRARGRGRTTRRAAAAAVRGKPADQRHRPPLGHRSGDRFTSPMLLPEKSFGRPFWRSSRSTIRAARSSWKRKRRAS